MVDPSPAAGAVLIASQDVEVLADIARGVSDQLGFEGGVEGSGALPPFFHRHAGSEFSSLDEIFNDFPRHQKIRRSG